jgi:hypothetical protein
MEADCVGLKETARRLGYSVSTLRKLVNGKVAPPSFGRGKLRRFPVKGIEKYIAVRLNK